MITIKQITELFIFFFVPGLLMGSMSQFQLPCANQSSDDDRVNVTSYDVTSDNDYMSMTCDPEPVFSLQLVEYICIVWLVK